MSRLKKYDYSILYTDNSGQVVEWNKDEYKKVGEYIEAGKPAIMLEDGIFHLKHIKSIRYIPPVPEPTEDEKVTYLNRYEQEMREWGMADPAVIDWLKAHDVPLPETEGVDFY